MKKLLLAFLVFSLSAMVAMAQQHGLGLKQHDPLKDKPRHLVKINVSPKLPAAVDHTDGMPPVGDQGSQGSCTAWATSYYSKTYQEYAEHGWDVSDPRHQFSPAFVYNQINGGVDGGSYIDDAFQLLCDLGSGSYYQFPYNQSDFATWPSEAAYDTGISYRCQNWYSIYSADDAGITAIKQVISDGGNVVIGLEVFPNFDNINAYDTVYCAADLSGLSRGGHAQCFLGYDDNKATHDGLGAFRAVNSWGTGWGNKGYYWMSYQAVKNSQITPWPYVYYATDRIGYVPALKMRTRLLHQKRGQIRIRVGVGDTLAPLWERAFYYNPAWDHYYSGGDHPYPENNIVFDLTEGASFLSTGTGNTIFLRCIDITTDGAAGQVLDLSADQVLWGVSASSHQTPKNITDDNSPVYTSLSLHYQDFTNTVWPAQQTIAQGSAAGLIIRVSPLNGYSSWVKLSASVFPLPAQGSLSISLAADSLLPLDSCAASLASSADVSPGLYNIAVMAVDSADTITHISTAAVWVLGSGQALCVGSGGAIINLMKKHWASVDSLEQMPPIIGSQYQALVLESGITPADSINIRQYVENGGNLLLIGSTPHQLCGGSDLTSISPWLGAKSHAWYTGTGMKLISDRTAPFDVSTINVGDTLGTALYNWSRLSSLVPGAAVLGHYGTFPSIYAALYNEYGSGRCFWFTVGAGTGVKSDSLIDGFLGHPALGIESQYATAEPSLSTITLNYAPNPFKLSTTINYQIPKSAMVSLKVYNLAGQLVKVLDHGLKSPGAYRVNWNGGTDGGSKLSGGIYFVRIQAETSSLVKKILLLR
ncbi:T9SS type A sorting domain-containing protein [candidate division TA06 bacterium]|uniref:T9SS type A sorting domain-containing protein n=1 Tax=candidate division TA06 bacterium TaxID=2250710 RepID=A0A933IB78_UNCT6|nr:T9SS type A sorting domain-containing protein [candidate division TA06 bacterium]